ARGIGPKTACAILATGDMAGLANAITEGDVKYLTKFPKIGPKTASQIILDLQGKLDVSGVATAAVMSKNGNLDEALEALEALGYRAKELKRVQSVLKASTDSVDELIKQGLKLMMQ
ncbi:MAG: Holliday junction branch migration protein RuvA, partial [Defluviitaleaceae bacterium]|nr:Holliday junction branch migration protein RuvA [Defluviitaleaceae bacterium]